MPIKPTTFRLDDEALHRLERLSEHLRSSMGLSRVTRTWALNWLILETLDERGVPSWQAVNCIEPECCEAEPDDKGEDR